MANEVVIHSFVGNDIEGNFNVVYSSTLSGYTYDLYLYVNDKTLGVIDLETFSNYISGTNVYLSNENVSMLYGLMGSVTTVTIVAGLKIFNNGVYIGISENIANVCSIDNASPIITASVAVDSVTNSLTGSDNVLIKYYSTATATMSAEAQKGASINESKYIIRNGSENIYSNEGTFSNVESNEFIFSAEDSRGRPATENIILSIVDYIKLTCNIASNRPDALGNMSVACSGNYFNNSFGSVTNTLTVQYRYGITGGSYGAWQDMTVVKNGNTYYAYADFEIDNFSQSRSYSFETRAIDKIETVSSADSGVKSTPIFHWGENDFVFEVPVEFKHGINSNTDFTISAPKLNFVGDEVYIGGNEIPSISYDTWVPQLLNTSIFTYTKRQGWYNKVGNIVNVGFYIKAVCNQDYIDSDEVSIGYLPYTPVYSASGGGICSGVYVLGNFNFQCFVAEVNGTITTRVQACNNTDLGILSTSASGCEYPNITGNEITLSGTITYITVS